MLQPADSNKGVLPVGLKERIQNEILILDGAMGTMLQSMGLPTGEFPETYNITHPEVVRQIHRGYLESGSNIIYANTFGASKKKAALSGYSYEELIVAGIAAAKAEAQKYNAYVALDIGPLGELMEPMGQLTFEEAFEQFSGQIRCGVQAGADLIVIETMTDLYECKAALLAAKENSSLPIFCTMSFEQNMRTFAGSDYRAMALTLGGLGADAIGINCSLGPQEILPIVRELIKYTNLPVVVKPNAGLPSPDGTYYAVQPTEFAKAIAEFVKLGVNIVGGCCGTNTQYIAAVKKTVEGLKPVKRCPVKPCAVCSASRVTEINRVCVVGERVNPTGKKLFRQALIDRNIGYIVKQAVEQVEAGADILDVNVGIPDIDEKEMLVTVVKAIQAVTDIPLQIDSSDPMAIEAALRVYNGKAIVNSVNGDEKVLDTILPIVRKYGAAVVGLTLDERGIPENAQQRYEIAQKIVSRAEYYGIPRRDVFIDCLTLTVSAQQQNAAQTLEALRLVKEKLGVKTLLGVSNISFGLPERELINKTFLTMALQNGLDLPIVNPNIPAIMDVIYAFNVLTAQDINSELYVERFANTAEAKPSQQSIEQLSIGSCIKKGLKEQCREEARRLLKSNEPMEVVNSYLIPALDEVGKEYEAGKIYLPQLIQAAETAKYAFEVVNAAMPKSQQENDKTIVLATVKGDIHDIGKNIVKVILENYGYRIIDLGRDVAPQAVVEAAQKSGARMVGLSALMTTTIKSMEETIQALHKHNICCKICVGGAVLTPEYAAKMGADYYAKDANDAVTVAKAIYSEPTA
ncbi:5-methyltetrahydrofolate--homocysteine methyltransferase [Acetanaerobacterium elongatum]|uniref:Methionine synthase n=1 Tax=Acetanaerobacterium elongatum TaxID=258515 RepID=A0A1G9WWV5_9FIRM|nr:5-methyltetrahydrofolate--homocysteine methyltransferase [Acetanaerobacterium elongatum]